MRNQELVPLDTASFDGDTASDGAAPSRSRYNRGATALIVVTLGLLLLSSHPPPLPPERSPPSLSPPPSPPEQSPPSLSPPPSPPPPQRHPYKVWSGSVKAAKCPSAVGAVVSCTVAAGGVKVFHFPPGIFEIDEQLLVPERVHIVGARPPNDASDPTKPPDWAGVTLFLATRGATDYLTPYCHAADMVKTRVGFVLSSYVTVRNVAYQGVDTIRPMDNGALCGGGAFETKGCAENDCRGAVNNGGSDGLGSTNVTVENVSLNDFYFAADRPLVGAKVVGNADCGTSDWRRECCFCRPNGVRSSQVGVWVPATRDAAGTRHLLVRNVVSRSNQADGINLHGYVRDALVEGAHFANTGDDTYALWGASLNPEGVTFRDCVAVDPGVLRPGWYGNCVATYGLRSVLFERIRCVAPTLAAPIPQPRSSTTQIDTSMFVFYTSFGGTYPSDNEVTIAGWSFTDMDGNQYRAANGTMGDPGLSGKKAWTRSDTGAVAPYFLPSRTQRVNVQVRATRSP